MEQLPNEIFIQIFEHLDPVSYVSFLETGFRKSELINTTQYESMKKEYVDWLDKEKFKRDMKESIENKEFGDVSELAGSGINTDKWDTSSMTPDIINVLSDNMYDIIKEVDTDEDENIMNSETLMKMMEKLNSVPAFQTEEFQSAMRSLGQSVINNNPEFLVNGMFNNILNLDGVPNDLPEIVPIPDVQVPDGVPDDLRDAINNLPEFNPANVVNEMQGIFIQDNNNQDDEIIHLRPNPNFNPPVLMRADTAEDSDDTPEDNEN